MPASAPVLVDKTLTYRIVRSAVHLLLRVFFGLEVRGRGHLPQQGRIVLVVNHQSFLDIPIIAAAAARRHVSFLARDSLARWKPMAWLMRQCGAVLVRRGQADRRAVKEMIEHLEREDCLCVFPEGTRSRDGRLGEFKGGALIAARRTHAPVVPVAIEGVLDVLPRGRRLPRAARITVNIAPPLDGTTPDALERAHAEVARMLGPTAAPSLEARSEPSSSPAGEPALTRSENP